MRLLTRAEFEAILTRCRGTDLDGYRELAVAMFDVPAAEVTRPQRETAKRYNIVYMYSEPLPREGPQPNARVSLPVRRFRG